MQNSCLFPLNPLPLPKIVATMKPKSHRNFCDRNPLFWTISKHKNIVARRLKNLLGKDRFAKTKQTDKLPEIISTYTSVLIKTGKGIDPVTQQNKAVNIRIAAAKISGIIIRPGETFSFWRIVGTTTKRKGYKEGRILKNNKLITGTGGGLCNLANTINNMVLHSPLTITEFHKHTDALACDIDHRVPMANGTSVSFNYIDYRFKNITNQNVQLILWCDDTNLYGELRSTKSFDYTYALIEEGHHFERQGDTYYRISKIYRTTTLRTTGEITTKELIWDNRSEVMFDPTEIPAGMIR